MIARRDRFVALALRDLHEIGEEDRHADRRDQRREAEGAAQRAIGDALDHSAKEEDKTALAQCRTLSRTQGIDLVMRRHRLDAIVAPTGSPAWTTDLINGDHFIGASSTLIRDRVSRGLSALRRGIEEDR